MLTTHLHHSFIHLIHHSPPKNTTTTTSTSGKWQVTLNGNSAIRHPWHRHPHTSQIHVLTRFFLLFHTLHTLPRPPIPQIHTFTPPILQFWGSQNCRKFIFYLKFDFTAPQYHRDTYIIQQNSSKHISNMLTTHLHHSFIHLIHHSRPKNTTTTTSTSGKWQVTLNENSAIRHPWHRHPHTSQIHVLTRFFLLFHTLHTLPRPPIPQIHTFTPPILQFWGSQNCRKFIFYPKFDFTAPQYHRDTYIIQQNSSKHISNMLTTHLHHSFIHLIHHSRPKNTTTTTSTSGKWQVTLNENSAIRHPWHRHPHTSQIHVLTRFFLLFHTLHTLPRPPIPQIHTFSPPILQFWGSQNCRKFIFYPKFDFTAPQYHRDTYIIQQNSSKHISNMLTTHLHHSFIHLIHHSRPKTTTTTTSTSGKWQVTLNENSAIRHPWHRHPHTSQIHVLTRFFLLFHTLHTLPRPPIPQIHTFTPPILQFWGSQNCRKFIFYPKFDFTAPQYHRDTYIIQQNSSKHISNMLTTHLHHSFIHLIHHSRPKNTTTTTSTSGKWQVTLNENSAIRHPWHRHPHTSQIHVLTRFFLLFHTLHTLPRPPIPQIHTFTPPILQFWGSQNCRKFIFYPKFDFTAPQYHRDTYIIQQNSSKHISNMLTTHLHHNFIHLIHHSRPKNTTTTTSTSGKWQVTLNENSAIRHPWHRHPHTSQIHVLTRFFLLFHTLHTLPRPPIPQIHTFTPPSYNFGGPKIAENSYFTRNLTSQRHNITGIHT